MLETRSMASFMWKVSAEGDDVERLTVHRERCADPVELQVADSETRKASSRETGKKSGLSEGRHICCFSTSVAHATSQSMHGAASQHTHQPPHDTRDSNSQS